MEQVHWKLLRSEDDEDRDSGIGTGRVSRQRVGQVFSAVLRELRNARGISQERLAELAGFHRTYLSLLERARRTPTLSAIFRLADALDVAPEHIVQDVEGRLRLEEAEGASDGH